MDNNKKFIEELDNYVFGKKVCAGEYADVYEKIDLGAKLKYQEIINNYFKVGAEQPLKKLLADINNAAGKDTLNLNFLCYLSCYYAYIKNYIDEPKKIELPNENKIYFKEGKEVGMDFAAAFEFYKILKLKNLDPVNKKKITNMFDQFYSFSKEIRKDVYDFYLKIIEANDAVFDYDVMDFIDLIICDDSASKLKNENQIKDIFSDNYIGKDKKIDFKFLRLAMNNINYDLVRENKAVKKQLIKYFDNKMSSWDFDFYLLEKDFIDPEVIPEEQIKEIIDNLELEKDEKGQISKIKYGNFVKQKNALEKYNDKKLIKALKTKYKNNIQPDESYYQSHEKQELEIISDPDLSDIEYAKKFIENRIEDAKKDENKKIKSEYYEGLKRCIADRKDLDDDVLKLLNEVRDNVSGKIDCYFEKYTEKELDQAILKNNPNLHIDILKTNIDNNKDHEENLDQQNNNNANQVQTGNNVPIDNSSQNIDNKNSENKNNNVNQIKNDEQDKVDNKKDFINQDDSKDNNKDKEKIFASKYIDNFFKLWNNVEDYDADNKAMSDLKDKLKSCLNDKDVCLKFFDKLKLELEKITSDVDKVRDLNMEYTKKLKARLNYLIDVFAASDFIKMNCNYDFNKTREKINSIDVLKRKEVVLSVLKALIKIVSLVFMYWGIKDIANYEPRLIKKNVFKRLKKISRTSDNIAQKIQKDKDRDQ